MVNLLKYEDQIYLLNYYIRSNFENVMKAINNKNKATLIKLVRDILLEEFNIRDDVVLMRIIELLIN